MEIGNLISEMGQAARADDPEKIKDRISEIRTMTAVDEGIRNPFKDYDAIMVTVDSNLGYLTGYLPSEYGNKILQWCDLEHPFFGRMIPDSADAALAAGLRMGEELREVKMAQERKAKRAVLARKGIDLPDVNDTVSSADAKEILAKLSEVTKARALADLEAAASDPIIESKFTPLGEEAARPVVVPNAIEKMIAPEPVPEPEPDTEEDEEDYDEDIFDMDSDLPEIAPATVVTPTKPEDVSRILETDDDAGAF